LNLVTEFIEGNVTVGDIVHDDTSQRRQKEEQLKISSKNNVEMKKEEHHMGEYLQNLVVVDHAEQSVVLTIRGTFSIRDVIVDLLAFTEPFCGGHAHA